VIAGLFVCIAVVAIFTYVNSKRPTAADKYYALMDQIDEDGFWRVRRNLGDYGTWTFEDEVDKREQNVYFYAHFAEFKSGVIKRSESSHLCLVVHIKNDYENRKLDFQNPYHEKIYILDEFGNRYNSLRDPKYATYNRKPPWGEMPNACSIMPGEMLGFAYAFPPIVPQATQLTLYFPAESIGGKGNAVLRLSVNSDGSIDRVEGDGVVWLADKKSG